MTCAKCSAIFVQIRAWQRYCSARCQINAMRMRMRASTPPPYRPPKLAAKPKSPRRRGLHCHWCSGKHISTACPNRNGTSVKQFGTLGPNREYIPPPGVNVRVLSIPTTLHSDTLTRIMKEIEP